MAPKDRRQAARYLSIPTIFDKDFIPEVGKTFREKKVIDVFHTRNWNMAIVLFNDSTMACSFFERLPGTVKGRSNLYLLELDEIPKKNIDYWFSKYYYLDGDMKEMSRAKLRFSNVEEKWEGKLYFARDKNKNNYLVIVR